MLDNFNIIDYFFLYSFYLSILYIFSIRRIGISVKNKSFSILFLLGSVVMILSLYLSYRHQLADYIVYTTVSFTVFVQAFSLLFIYSRHATAA